MPISLGIAYLIFIYVYINQGFLKYYSDRIIPERNHNCFPNVLSF